MEESATSVTEKPVCVFESQADDEKLVLMLRSHPITNVPWILVVVALALIPILAINFGILNDTAIMFGVPTRSFFGIFLLWYLFVFVVGFQSFLVWYFNLYFLTDRRIVDIDFYQLLYKKISSAQLSKIEDITSTMGGVAQVVFNYGNVTIQTAGEVPEFEFHRVAKPGEVRKIIESEMHKNKGGKND